MLRTDYLCFLYLLCRCVTVLEHGHGGSNKRRCAVSSAGIFNDHLPEDGSSKNMEGCMNLKASTLGGLFLPGKAQ